MSLAGSAYGRVADLIWADMESLKYNNITITPEEAPKAAKKIQLTKKTGTCVVLVQFLTLIQVLQASSPTRGYLRTAHGEALLFRVCSREF